MTMAQASSQNDVEFDIEEREEGIRIYARKGEQIVGALAAEFYGRYLAISLIYIVPTSRHMKIDEALQTKFFGCLETCSERWASQLLG